MPKGRPQRAKSVAAFILACAALAATCWAGGREKVLTGGDSDTTNNRMELEAAIAALEALKAPSRVELHTDSTYLQLGITEWLPGWIARGWRKRDRQPALRAFCDHPFRIDPQGIDRLAAHCRHCPRICRSCGDRDQPRSGC